MKRTPWLLVVFEWIWKAILLNWYWFAFTILGLGIFGFFPASIALFHVLRKWMRKQTDIPVFKEFKRIYFKEWKQGNKIGFVFYGIAFFLYVDIQIVDQLMTGFLANSLFILLWILFFILLLAVGYFFAIYSHYELSNKVYLKQSFLFALTSLPTTILIILGFSLIGYMIYEKPGLIPFVSAVLPAFWMMRVTLSRFTAIEKRTQQTG
ncbi:YesL family protein [Paraliobacillus salinarum]|uniref:YesL family protein n=1 Tax=Paraliobacillus salinarum TaxID=1158996 RepID=UPI0015F49BF8|nr:DUF624 domain-containing protein [Paraliobacillus salinarum]